MKLGLVGYGAGGRLFHAPYIAAVDEIELAGVVTRSPQRRAEVGADHPDVAVFDSLGDLLDTGVDAVAITTPPETRRALVLEAISRGVHVIADKPFAPDAAGGRELAAAAAKAGVLLSVFHNRRFDTDITTIGGVLPRLGEIWRVESRFDLDEPGQSRRGPGRRATTRPGSPPRRPDARAVRAGGAGLGTPRSRRSTRRAYRLWLRGVDDAS